MTAIAPRIGAAEDKLGMGREAAERRAGTQAGRQALLALGIDLRLLSDAALNRLEALTQAWMTSPQARFARSSAEQRRMLRIAAET
jgi:hypothetical protein